MGFDAAESNTVPDWMSEGAAGAGPRLPSSYQRMPVRPLFETATPLALTAICCVVHSRPPRITACSSRSSRPSSGVRLPGCGTFSGNSVAGTAMSMSPDSVGDAVGFDTRRRIRLPNCALSMAMK
jgi:hypothetical protein